MVTYDRQYPVSLQQVGKTLQNVGANLGRVMGALASERQQNKEMAGQLRRHHSGEHLKDMEKELKVALKKVDEAVRSRGVAHGQMMKERHQHEAATLGAVQAGLGSKQAAERLGRLLGEGQEIVSRGLALHNALPAAHATQGVPGGGVMLRLGGAPTGWDQAPRG